MSGEDFLRSTSRIGPKAQSKICYLAELSLKYTGGAREKGGGGGGILKTKVPLGSSRRSNGENPGKNKPGTIKLKADV